MLIQLQNYLNRLFNADIKPIQKDDLKKLPYLYKDLFAYAHGEIQGQDCLFAIDNHVMHLTATKIKKHMDYLKEQFHKHIIYVDALSTPHITERLIKQNVPFVAPEKHLYLPALAIHITPEKKQPKQTKELFSLSAQLIIIAVLLNELNNELTIIEVTERLPFTRTSILAAFDELEFFELGVKDKVPFSKTILFKFSYTGVELWNKSMTYFRNPCRRVVGIEELPNDINLVIAAEDALAQRSMLAESTNPVLAMAFSKFTKLGIDTIITDIAPHTLQLWWYEPTIFGKDKIDTLSLYLTLKNNLDERVQIELDELMKGLTW